MKNSQRKQVLVKLANHKEGEEFIKYLEGNGLLNVHNISFDKLRIKVLVVDKNEFFSTNVTCLAALASCGIKPISVNDFKASNELKTDIINCL